MKFNKLKDVQPFKAGIFADDTVDRNKNIIRLSLSESPYGMCEAAKRSVQDEINKATLYPDSNYNELRKCLSEKYNIEQEMSLVGNGADELILLAALAFVKPNGYAITTKSTFKGYSAAIEAVNAKCIEVDLEGYSVSISKIIEAINGDTSLVYICNPHNPTGTVINRKEIFKLIDKCDKLGIVVVIDEAYAEYTNCDVFKSALDYVKEKKLVVVLRTFSKIYGLAGLRCGYAIAQPALINSMAFARNVLPFNTNRLACKAAIESIKCTEFVESVRANNLMVKMWMYDQLKKLNIKFQPSETNFVMIELPCCSESFSSILYERFNILVRDLTMFDFKNHIRVSLGTKETMEYFIKSLHRVIKILEEQSPYKFNNVDNL